MGFLSTAALPKLSVQWKLVAGSCANPDCRPTSLLNNLGRRREGLTMDNHWYCSADCFEEGAQGRLAELCRVDIPAEHSRRFRIPLGLVLLSRGIINNVQLQAALAEQRTHGGRIGEILVRSGCASEEQVTAGVAAQWGHPVFALQDRVPESQIELPVSLLELHSVLPVHYVRAANKLMLGFAQQIDSNFLYAVEHMTGAMAVPCFITPSDFRAQLRMFPAAAQNEEVQFDRISSVLEMARIARSYATQTAAVSVRFTRCRKYIWTRIEGQRHKIELIFRLPGC